MIGFCGWWMIYSMPCVRASKAGSTGALLYPLRHMVRYWRSYRVWEVMCMNPPTQWLSDPPWYLSIFVSFSPIKCVAMKSVISKDVSNRKGDFLNLNSYFVFVPHYYWIIFLMMWSVWSILIPYLLWIMLMLRIFTFGTYWNV